MRSILNFFCFFATVSSLVNASPLQKRQSDLSSQEIQNINAIKTSLTTLNSTLNGFSTYDPLGVFEALKIQLQSSQVSNNLVAAAGTANESSTFTSDESGNIATAVLNLEPVIFSTLNNIVTHKPAFATAILFIGDISKTVEQNLIQQRELSREFANALAAKLAEPYASGAGLISGQIDNGR